MVMIQTQAKLIVETEAYQLLRMDISNWKEEKANHLESPFLPEFYRDKNP